MVQVTQADAEVARKIISGVRGYGVKFAHPLKHEGSLIVARHREAAVAEKDAEIARLREALSAILEGTYVGREDRPVSLKSRWGHYEARLYHKARAALANPS